MPTADIQKEQFEHFGGGRKGLFLGLRYVFIIAAAYLLIFETPSPSAAPFQAAMIACALASNVVLSWLSPPSLFAWYVKAPILVADTLWVSWALQATGVVGHEFFLLYLFVFFLAATGDNLLMVLLGVILISGANVYLVSTAPPWESPVLVLRIVFFFSVALFYGHAMKEIKRERRRADEGFEWALELEAKVAERTAHLAAIVESSDDAIIGQRLDGTIVSWNEGAGRIYDYAAREVMGKSVSILVPDERAEEVTTMLDDSGKGRVVKQLETVRLRKGGQRIDVSVIISPIRDTAGHVVGAASIARDITRQKQAEIQLRQAQKLESVGRLAAGIAHEINTPIQFIGDNTRFLCDGFAGFRSLIENYRTLLDAAAGGADMSALVRRVRQIEEVQAEIEAAESRLRPARA
jgi:PAS domain S-box-containing protein